MSECDCPAGYPDKARVEIERLQSELSDITKRYDSQVQITIDYVNELETARAREQQTFNAGYGTAIGVPDWTVTQVTWEQYLKNRT